ncbi:MAG: hypothetical protein ACK4IA_08670 [Paracoccus hibiscisoli]|uniref:hypothetical protein n=1 Tax=Paracoccus hibiscisoli TaxID=2023261 RepID=UPI00391B20A6
MDLKLHLDFCFSISADLVLAAGWTPRAQPDIVLHAGHASLSPLGVVRFARRDLRTLNRMGYLALFDLSSEPGATDPSEDLFLGLGKEYLPIRQDRLATDLSKMVEIGVDEIFFSYVRMIALGTLPVPAPQIAQRVVNRILAAPRLDRETPHHALNIDRGLVGPDGQGVAKGWFLPATASDQGLAALVINDRQISPAPMLPGCLPRPDLQPYAGRYAFGGRDGWAAAFRLPAAPSGPVQLVLLLPDQLAHSGIVQPLDLVAPDQIAHAVLETAQGIGDRTLAAQLHRATLPAPDQAPPALPDATDAPPDGTVLLVLDHDLDDVDLRDVLRRVTAAHDGTVMVHLLRPMLTEALQQALLGASREAACDLRLSGCAMTPPDPAEHPGQVVFARSSILFHVDPAPLLAPGTAALAVTVLDPMAALPGGSDHTALTDRLVDGRLPFACAGPGAVVLAPFAHPTAYLTAEAVLRDLAARLLSTGTASLVAAPAQGFLAGNRGPYCQSLIDGVGWHDFDGLSARLLTEAA